MRPYFGQCVSYGRVWQDNAGGHCIAKAAIRYYWVQRALGTGEHGGMADPLITLTTDFGTQDCYVSAMKGVIAKICPAARIIDLTHVIPPQDILAGALFLAGATHYYPDGTIHIVVVDPGVGTAREAIAAAAGGQIFVCPNNGLLSLIAERTPIERAVRLENRAYMLPDVSKTFHGRDIFAPAAAHIAAGVPLDTFGSETEVQLFDRDPAWVDEEHRCIRGEILNIDRFGNCISNIPKELIAGQHGDPSVRVDDVEVGPVRGAYGDVPNGRPLAIIGSNGMLEVAVNQGNAAQEMGFMRGSLVEIRL